MISYLQYAWVPISAIANERLMETISTGQRLLKYEAHQKQKKPKLAVRNALHRVGHSIPLDEIDLTLRADIVLWGRQTLILVHTVASGIGIRIAGGPVFRNADFGVEN